MAKPISELLDHLAEHIEYLEDDISTVNKEEEPNTYWYVLSGIEAYKAIAKKIEEEYL